MLPKRQWMEMTWTDLAESDTKRWIAVLPVAAVEQHGPHLPLGVDYYIAQAYVARVLPQLPADLPATFLPIQQVGQSDEHRAFPGTLSFSARTIVGTYTEIGESIHRCGVRKLVVVTSNGGNVPAMALVARDLRVRLKMLVVTCAWHRFGYPSGTFDRLELRHGVHAGDVETSLLLAHRPETVDMARAGPAVPATGKMAEDFKWLRAFRPVGFGWVSQDLHPTRGVRGPTGATAQKGEQALAHGARGLVGLLQEGDPLVPQWPGP